MSILDGYKTYIVVGMVVLIALVEGVLGIDIPGAEVGDNWLEYVLGALGLGGLRSALAKQVL